MPEPARSLSQSRSAATPPRTASARCCAVFSFARARRSTASGEVSAGAATTCRFATQSDTQSGTASSAGTSPRACSSCTATACLHGNFRDGHEHFVARSPRSTQTRYGFLPLPGHSPHSAVAVRPVPVHPEAPASRVALLATWLSGASSSTPCASMVER
jgi:hypothetical protein